MNNDTTLSILDYYCEYVSKLTTCQSFFQYGPIALLRVELRTPRNHNKPQYTTLSYLVLTQVSALCKDSTLYQVTIKYDVVLRMAKGHLSHHLSRAIVLGCV